jgi:hypothetical protein
MKGPGEYTFLQGKGLGTGGGGGSGAGGKRGGGAVGRVGGGAIGWQRGGRAGRPGRRGSVAGQEREEGSGGIGREGTY